jgi:hypothetical protein
LDIDENKFAFDGYSASNNDGCDPILLWLVGVCSGAIAKLSSEALHRLPL